MSVHASAITDTSIGEVAFSDCDAHTTITFNGTTTQWNNIEKQEDWNDDCPEITVTCTDGTITIPA